MLRTRSFLLSCLCLFSTPAIADDDTSKVLILHPDSESATQVLAGLADEVGEDLNLISVEFSSKLTTTDIDTLLAEHRADALVLMNNPTVELYRAYQQSKPEGTSFPPAVMLLTSFLEKTAVGIQNATGINYEVAAVSSMVNLRSLIESKVERVGVVYRDVFEDFVREQQVMAAQEKIQLVPRRVRSTHVDRDLKPLLRQLLVSDIDALWVLNDNQLLSPTSVAKTWLPALKHNNFPVVVGVQALVSSEFRFGTFALLPDHEALGVQAAQLLFELEESEWRADSIAVQEPVAVKKVLNVSQARRLTELNEDALRGIDVIIE